MSMNNTLAEIADLVRETNPLVHCITNYVTVNDCANALLAVGAAPVMADDRAEVCEISSIAQALLLNIGTLNGRTIASMKRAAKTANRKGLPVILDPVGAGASKLRTKTAQELIRIARPALIRGNVSEIATLLAGRGNTRGVDAAESDTGEDALARTITTAKTLANKTGAVVAVTGATDVITDGNRVITVRNGHLLLSRITGSGCMLSCLCAACCAAAPERILEAASAAVVMMGLCGELAAADAERSGNADAGTECAGTAVTGTAVAGTTLAGTATFRLTLIDRLSRITGSGLEQGAQCEESA